MAAVAVGVAVAASVSGAVGVAGGVVVAAAVAWGTRRRARRAVPDDPLAVAAAMDLFAACLRAGAANARAAQAAAEACSPDSEWGTGARGDAGAAPRLGTALRGVADRLALGEDPAEAWAVLAGEPGLEPIARLARRSADSGASLAREAGRLAESFRSGAEDGAVASAERAGVAIAGPLGMCFLPAFVCLGIAPVIVGLAGGILGGGIGL